MEGTLGEQRHSVGHTCVTQEHGHTLIETEDPKALLRFIKMALKLGFPAVMLVPTLGSAFIHKVDGKIQPSQELPINLHEEAVLRFRSNNRTKNYVVHGGSLNSIPSQRKVL